MFASLNLCGCAWKTGCCISCFLLTADLVRVQLADTLPVKVSFVLFSQRQSGRHPSEELAGLCGDISIHRRGPITGQKCSENPSYTLGLQNSQNPESALNKQKPSRYLLSPGLCQLSKAVAGNAVKFLCIRRVNYWWHVAFRDPVF